MSDKVRTVNYPGESQVSSEDGARPLAMLHSADETRGAQ